MGLTNATFGLCGGFAVVVVPEMLAAAGMPGGRIAAMVAWIISPTFWAFVLAPMLDVRISRRAYALIFGAVTAACVGLTVYFHTMPGLVVALGICSYASASLVQGAVGGWMGSLIPPEQDSKLGAWFSIGNLGAGGVMMLCGEEIVRGLPRTAGALVAAAMILSPALLYLWIPAPGPDRRLAKDSFAQFFGEVFALLKRPLVRIVLLIFALPSASFALTNVLAGIGNDFHASARMISLFAGVGSTVAAIAGSLLMPLFARRIPLRLLYLAVGVFGGVFTLALLLLPRTPWSFAIAITGENLLQASSFAVANGLIFETMGQDNPLAATQFTLLISASCLPITYMGFVDGHAYDVGGVTGSFAADAGISMLVCVLLAVWFVSLRRRGIWAAPAKPGEPV